MTNIISGRAYKASDEAGGGTTPKRMQLTTVDTAYPYTEQSSNNVVVRGSGPIRVVARVTITSGYSCVARLRINGSGTDTTTGPSANVSDFTYDFNDASDGDVLELWETDSGFTAVNVTSGQNNIFLYYVPLGGTRICSAYQRASTF